MQTYLVYHWKQVVIIWELNRKLRGAWDDWAEINYVGWLVGFQLHIWVWVVWATVWSREIQTFLSPATSTYSSGGTLKRSQASREIYCLQHVLGGSQLGKGPVLVREGGVATPNGGVQVSQGLVHKWGENGAGLGRILKRYVEVKRELSQKTNLSIYQSTYVLCLTYGREVWEVTKRGRLQIQAAEISFLHRMAGLSFRDRVQSSDIWEELRVVQRSCSFKKLYFSWINNDLNFKISLECLIHKNTYKHISSIKTCIFSSNHQTLWPKA